MSSSIGKTDILCCCPFSRDKSIKINQRITSAKKVDQIFAIFSEQSKDFNGINVSTTWNKIANFYKERSFSFSEDQNKQLTELITITHNKIEEFQINSFSNNYPTFAVATDE